MRARLRTIAAFASVSCALVCSCSDGQSPPPANSAAGIGSAPLAGGGGASLAASGGPVATSGAGPAAGGVFGGDSGSGGVTSSAGTASGGGGNGGGGANTGGAAGSSLGGGGGAGGSSGSGWVPIFNGQDLSNWYPKITGFPYKTDPYDTFKVESGVIKVGYEKYPGGNFDNHFGLLYYDKLLTNYRVRVEYHFLEPQAKSPPGWGKNNSGLMLFGLDPSKVQGDPSFPPLLEIQLLGNPSSGGDTNPNLCKPGGYTVTLVNGHPPGNDCDKSTIPAPPPPPAEWVTVEAEVHVNGDTKVFQYPNTTTPALTFSGAKTSSGQPLTSGYISLQSESQPCEFRKVELMELPE
jgi:hypothetical protein